MKKIIKNNEFIRIIKYTFSAGSSFVLDLLLFTIFSSMIFNNITNFNITTIIFISTVIARVMSSIYNYYINSRFVFKNKSRKTIIGYFLLVVIQMLMSALFVSLIKNMISINLTIIKFFVDIVIFIVNYIIQKYIIFKE